MDAVTLGEDVFLHVWIPAAGLVPEVRPGFQKLLDGTGLWQVLSPFCSIPATG
jgi:hypothetical protein